MSERLCDVVIATRNRPEPLWRCLRALADQSARNFGIIVVDDHSDEPLDSVIADVVATCSFEIEPTLIRLPRQSGPAAGRNAGVAASDAEFVIFIDDDVIVDRHLIDVHLLEVTSKADSGLPIVTRGPFVEPPDWNPTPWNHWEAQMATRGTNAIVRGDYQIGWRQFHTGNNCMPVAMFRDLGGFDESYKRMEDDEFGLRVRDYGCEIRFVPSALAYHYSNRSLESWLAVPRQYGYYTVVLDRQYPHVRYLEDRKNELAQSHALLRAARAVLGGARRTHLAVSAAVGLARVAHRLGVTAVSVPALSLAFDLQFAQGLREGESAPVGSTPP